MQALVYGVIPVRLGSSELTVVALPLAHVKIVQYVQSDNTTGDATVSRQEHAQSAQKTVNMDITEKIVVYCPKELANLVVCVTPASTVTAAKRFLKAAANSVRQAHTKVAKDRNHAVTVLAMKENTSRPWVLGVLKTVIASNAKVVPPASTVRTAVCRVRANATTAPRGSTRRPTRRSPVSQRAVTAPWANTDRDAGDMKRGSVRSASTTVTQDATDRAALEFPQAFVCRAKAVPRVNIDLIVAINPRGRVLRVQTASTSPPSAPRHARIARVLAYNITPSRVQAAAVDPVNIAAMASISTQHNRRACRAAGVRMRGKA
jgi:hypothetical protein